MNNVNEFKVAYDNLSDETMNFSSFRKLYMDRAMNLLEYMANNRVEINESYNVSYLWNRLTAYLDTCLEYGNEGTLF